MELKVWVEGIQRIVCGVTEITTCQDVVFALAHATGKTGRFTLIERWRNNERLLAPHENPLKILMKWGEYSNDVQFILQRSDQKQQQQQQQSQQQILRQQQKVNQNNNNNIEDTKIKLNNKNNNNIPPLAASTATAPLIAATNESSVKQMELITPIDRNKETRKSLNLGTSADIKNTENVGIVKGIPQKLSNVSPSPIANINNNSNNISNNNNNNNNINNNNNSNNSNNSSNASTLDANFTNAIKKSKSGEFNAADLRNSLDRKINSLMYNTNKETNLLRSNNLLGNDNLLLDTSSTSSVSSSSNNNLITSNNNSPIIGISSNGALVPPPYRDPPPPRNSPSLLTHKIDNNNLNNNLNNLNINRKFDKDNINMSLVFNNTSDINELNLNDVLLHNTQYRDLIQLIKFQREKINTQQADLTKFDAEIVYLEGKGRDQMEQLDAITQEISKTDHIFRQGNEQLQTFQYVEEESELVRQQEKTLKSEITLLRSKLANCETELLQCKNKIRLLMDEIQVEQRKYSRQYDSNRQQLERHLMSEVDRIQVEIDLAIQSSDQSNKTTDKLKNEVAIIETAIAEKKKQVEQLVHEMKEVNLQSLAVAPADEVRHLLEVGSVKPGSTRRMIGSPRQLENAVPTSKNPHGVWV